MRRSIMAASFGYSAFGPLASGVTSIEDAKTREIIMGATAPTANTTTTVTNPTMVLSADAVATRLGGGG